MINFIIGLVVLGFVICVAIFAFELALTLIIGIFVGIGAGITALWNKIIGRNELD